MKPVRQFGFTELEANKSGPTQVDSAWVSLIEYETVKLSVIEYDSTKV